jgi:hypothetical protein
MRGRSRHLNARDAGATMVLDARFISGSDGDAIGTWASRTSSTYDMTQATAANKPLLKLGANGINGQAAVLFDGTNDYMTGANEAINTCSIFAATYSSGAASYRNLFGRGSNVGFIRDFILIAADQANQILTNRSNSSSFPTATSSDFTQGNHVVYGDYDGTNLGCRVDLKTKATAAGVSAGANQSWDLGSLNDYTSGRQYWWDSNVGSVVFFKNSVVTSSVEKRITHSLAYSFKIACS